MKRSGVGRLAYAGVVVIATVTATMIATLIAMMVGPDTGYAHTALDFSVPTQDASVSEPITEITVGFTEPVTLVGNGFEVLNPQGEVVLPTPITDDDQVFRLLFDTPLAGGAVGVAYEVTSLDGHVVSGGFAFTVDAPLPTTTTTPTTTVPATTIAPETTTTTTATTTTASTTDGATESTTTTPDSTTTAPATTAASSTVPVADGADDESGGNTGLYLAIAAAVAIVALGFLLVRGRSGSPATP